MAKQKTEMSYALTDNESFKMLYQNTLPLLAVSMFPTECLVLNPYSDNKNNVQNTIGLGSYWYPKNGDSKSTEWMKASEYFKQTSKHTITAEHALDLVDGWYCHRESDSLQNALFSYSIQSTVSFEKEQQENLTVSPDVIYTEALAHYNNAGKLEKEGKEAKSQKEYAVALETFQKLTSAGYKGADLYNDIAITYYHLGEYQKCIDESKHVLETGEESAYAAANYNAAKAYEKLGLKERAVLNYRAAIAHGADTAMCERAINKLSSSPQTPKLEQDHSR